jgi:hypothetical protein
MPYNTKNRYEQGQALRKEIYMYIVSYIKLVGYAPSGHILRLGTE